MTHLPLAVMDILMNQEEGVGVTHMGQKNSPSQIQVQTL